MPVDSSKEALWKAMQEHNGRMQGNDGTSSGGGDGQSPGAGIGIKDYVDSKNEAMESRLVARLDQLATRGTIWGAVATGTAILLAVLALAGDRFDAGLANGDVRLEQLQRDQKQDQNLGQINDKIDQLLKQKANQ